MTYPVKLTPPQFHEFLNGEPLPPGTAAPPEPPKAPGKRRRCFLSYEPEILTAFFCVLVSEVDKKLYEEAFSGTVGEVKSLFLKHPEVNVNYAHEGGEGKAALHHACEAGHVTIVDILLAHPDIDVNQKTHTGKTPFFFACFYGKTSCVRAMLHDARVSINERETDGYTPLCWAAFHGYIDVIHQMIASGRELDLGKSGEKGDAIGEAGGKKKTQIVKLLHKYKKDHMKTADQIRKDLKIKGNVASCCCFFASV